MYLRLIISILSICALTSCFTGVEGTKRIDLGRNERKQVALSPEESILSEVQPLPLSQWSPGMQFLVSNEKISLLLESDFPQGDSFQNDTLQYLGLESRTSPDGSAMAVLSFRSRSGNKIFRYPTGKELSKASENLKSDQLPMLIDLQMVSEAEKILCGKEFYTLTKLWYTTDDKRVDGTKFTPIKIVDVTPGNSNFPLAISFVDSTHNLYKMYLNFGNSGFESRSFASQLSLSDIRKRYSSISDSNWQLICNGKVAKGMTKEECKLALGNPMDVSAGHDYSKTIDIWQYTDGKFLRFADGILIDFR